MGNPGYVVIWVILDRLVLRKILLPADLAKIKRQAREQHRSLRDYCQDEIIGSMVLAEFA